MHIDYNLISDMKRQRHYASSRIYDLKDSKLSLVSKMLYSIERTVKFCSNPPNEFDAILPFRDNINCCRVINLTLKIPMQVYDT